MKTPRDPMTILGALRQCLDAKAMMDGEPSYITKRLFELADEMEAALTKKSLPLPTDSLEEEVKK